MIFARRAPQSRVSCPGSKTHLQGAVELRCGVDIPTRPEAISRSF